MSQRQIRRIRPQNRNRRTPGQPAFQGVQHPFAQIARRLKPPPDTRMEPVAGRDIGVKFHRGIQRQHTAQQSFNEGPM